jgi:hypothetical protein
MPAAVCKRDGTRQNQIDVMLRLLLLPDDLVRCRLRRGQKEKKKDNHIQFWIDFIERFCAHDP